MQDFLLPEINASNIGACISWTNSWQQLSRVAKFRFVPSVTSSYYLYDLDVYFSKWLAVTRSNVGNKNKYSIKYSAQFTGEKRKEEKSL